MPAALALRQLFVLGLTATVASGGHAPPVVTGFVTDAATAAPISGAQVIIPGSTNGGLTDSLGAYRFVVRDGVAGQTVEVAVQALGYASDARRVRLRGDSTRADFTLQAQALSLESVVVGARGEVMFRTPPVAGVKIPFSRAPQPSPPPVHPDTEAYAHIEENAFRDPALAPLSTFAIDVDRASYANVRRYLESGRLPPVDAVRIEELVNYFPYGDAPPEDGLPFAVNTELGPAPWQPAHRLLRIGLQGKRVATADLPPANLVFLIDVSGSMQAYNKLPLVKQALAMVVEELRPVDRVAMVVYAGAAGVVLPPTSGSERHAILEAIHRLEAGGSTAGGAGLRLAYQLAAKGHIAGGVNRVILATDGDFNVGVSSDAEMVRLVERARESGTAITVLGFGSGNLKDSKLEAIADHGNGNYAYIDDLAEARKALVEERGGTFFTLASDVKIQVEFNPARVHAYRLIGYENRLLAAEDFADDGKDAGELGAGHTVTALYEIVPTGVEHTVETGTVAPLRYQEVRPDGARALTEELAFVRLRYKASGEDASRLLEHPVTDGPAQASDDLRFAAAVAGFGMILRDSEHRGALDFAQVLELAGSALGPDPGGHRTAFLDLVRQARRVAAVAPPEPGRR